VALSTKPNDGGTVTQSAHTVTLSAGQAVLEAARTKATQIGVPMNIAVVNEGGNLVAFARMDDAWLGSIDIAQNKAYTARAFDMPTKDLAPLAHPGGALYGIEASNGGRLIVFAYAPNEAHHPLRGAASRRRRGGTWLVASVGHRGREVER
jgi:uncharacterized protein GlcG (DUF336 family)